MRRGLTLFYRHLGAALRAGIPLAQGIALAGEACGDARVARAGADVVRRLRAGGTLARSLAAHPGVFGETDVALVSVAEEHGRLDAALQKLAERGEAGHHARRRFLLALAYPSFLLLALLFLPPLGVLVRESPAAYLRAVARGAFPLVAPAATIAAALLLFRRAAPAAFARTLLSVPVVGRALKKLAIARFASSLAALFDAGVDVRRSLRLAVRALANPYLERRCAAVPRVVEKGGTLAAALAEPGIFPSELVGAVDVGERAGELPRALDAFARLAEEEGDRAMTALAIAVPVLIYLLVAAAIAVVVVSTFGGYFGSLGNF